MKPTGQATTKTQPISQSGSFTRTLATMAKVRGPPAKPGVVGISRLRVTIAPTERAYMPTR
jgi:hypothetical protein